MLQAARIECAKMKSFIINICPFFRPNLQKIHTFEEHLLILFVISFKQAFKFNLGMSAKNKIKAVQVGNTKYFLNNIIFYRIPVQK